MLNNPKTSVQLSRFLLICAIIHSMYVIGIHAVPKRLANLFDVSNKTFIFISGFPHSGTSLLQQIFQMSPVDSTMVTGCFKKYRYRPDECMKTNCEGQWMRTRHMKEIEPYLQPGRMFSVNSSAYNKDQLESLRDKWIDFWGEYWDLSRSFLVEKSPQSMLKSFAYSTVFHRAEHLKFIILIKHPITLQCAIKRISMYTPKVTWSKTNGQANTQSQDRDNLRIFTTMMNGSKTGLGWIAAYNELHHQLSSTNLSQNYAILRYEDFSRPYDVCLAIMQFTHAHNKDAHTAAVNQVCNKYFIRAKSRQLSLRNRNYHTLNFQSRSAVEEGQARLLAFGEVYNRASVEDKLALEAMDKASARFGYRFFSGTSSADGTQASTTRSVSVLDEWDLMLRYYSSSQA